MSTNGLVVKLFSSQLLQYKRVTIILLRSRVMNIDGKISFILKFINTQIDVDISEGLLVDNDI